MDGDTFLGRQEVYLPFNSDILVIWPVLTRVETNEIIC